ncbi:MAG: SBBP repeat-containing protein, partial [Nitrospira sp.]|nr:SBBP repeat-containing protein [Nitrospira sp.]
MLPYSLQTTVGYQMLGVAARVGNLRTAINNGLEGGASYLEIYESDITDPNSREDIAYANTQLQVPLDQRDFCFLPEASQFRKAKLLPTESPAGSGAISPKPDPVTEGRMHLAFGKLPLSFEANQGQTDAQVKFLSRGKGYALYLTSTEAVLVLRSSSVVRGKRQQSTDPSTNLRAGNEQQTTDNEHVLRMRLIEANREPKVIGMDELPGKSNYLIGNDPKKWCTSISSYVKVKYEGVYPGVDLIYYGNQQQLEYDFVIAPGADPKVIQLAFEGADKVEIGTEGDLRVGIAGEEIRLHKPQVYQEVDGIKQPISGSYAFVGPESPNNGPFDHAQDRQWTKISFQVAAYDTHRPLIIDPILIYSTYLGGGKNENVSFDFAGTAVDSSGNVYVIGETNSVNFPITPGSAQSTFNSTCSLNGDVFVTKLNAAGTALVYSTYLG